MLDKLLLGGGEKAEQCAMFGNGDYGHAKSKPSSCIYTLYSYSIKVSQLLSPATCQPRREGFLLSLTRDHGVVFTAGGW